jgi:hypothetical protein
MRYPPVMSTNRLIALLSRPSSQSWHAICDLFACWPTSDERDAALLQADVTLQQWPEKAMSMLEGWPMPNRIAPKAWRKGLMKGEIPVGWSLVRFLQYHDDKLTQQHLTTILGCGQLSRITHLYFGQNGLKPPLLGALADAAAGLESVEAISLRGNSISGDRLTDFLSVLGAQLTWLNLGACGVRDADIEQLASSDQLTGLLGLDLSSSRFSEEGLDVLLSCPNLPALEFLKLTTFDTAKHRMSYAHYTQAQNSNGLRHLRRAAQAGRLAEENNADLKKRCKDLSIRGYSKLKKPGLIGRLLQHWDAENPS